MGEVIGSGGFSLVRKVTDRWNREAVCKIIRIGTRGSEKLGLGQYEHETAVMRHLLRQGACEKVPAFIDAYRDDRNGYIVQEMCSGGSVADYVETHGHTSTIIKEKEIINIIRGTLTALHDIHMRNVIHGDIKAGNVLFSVRRNTDDGDNIKDEDVRIIDFGSSLICHSRSTSVHTTTGELVGTQPYMAPETLQHMHCQKSDVWSVGVLAYHLLSDDHTLPFTNDACSIWHNIIYEDPQKKMDKFVNAAAASRHATDFIRKALSKDHRRRPTALECLDHAWMQE